MFSFKFRQKLHWKSFACLFEPTLQTQVGKQPADRGQQHQLVAQTPMMQPPQPQMQPPPAQILDLLTPEMKQQLWASYVQGCNGLFGQQAQGQPNIVYFQNKGAGQPNDPSAAQLQLQLPSGSTGLPNTIAANGQASTASAGQGSTVAPSTVNAQQQQQQTNQAKIADSDANSNMVNAQLRSIEALSGTQDGNKTEQKTLEDIETEHMARLEKKAQSKKAAKAGKTKQNHDKKAPKQKLKLGCLRCRGCHKGCSQCRDPSFGGLRLNRQEWLEYAKKHGLKVH